MNEAEGAPFLVEWYRPRQLADLRRTCVNVGLVLLVGLALLIVVVNLEIDGEINGEIDGGVNGEPDHGAAAWRDGGLGAAIALCLGSPLYLGWRLRRSLIGATSLALRSDGLTLSGAAGERFVPWAETLEPTLSELGDAVVILLQDGARLGVEHRFEGISPGDLRRRIVDVRRRALGGQLQPSEARSPGRLQSA